MNHEDNEIKQAMAHLSEETPIELKAKLRMMATTATVRRHSPWPARLAMAGVAVAAIAVVGISMMPQPASAKTFAKVVQATRDARSFSFTIDSFDAAKSGRVTIAFQDGRFGLRTDDKMVMQIDGTNMKFYNPEKNELVIMKLGGFIDAKMIAGEIDKGLKQGLAEMDLKKMMEDYAKQYGKENISVGPILQRYGRSEYEITMVKPGEDRVHLTVDADTDLPTHIEAEKLVSGDWKRAMSMSLQFGGNIDPQLLDPQFPAGAKITELDLGGLAGEARKAIGDGKRVGEDMDKVGEKIGRIFDGLGKK